MADIEVLGISGSLRRESFNTGLLRAAIELAPPGMKISIADLRQIPLYDDDVYAAGFPPPVAELRRQIGAADAMLIATPEYNYSMPGVLKNAIDWVSRPPEQPFDGKPLAIMGASQGAGGTMRAQYHLRQTAVFLNLHPLNRPEVFVARAQERFAGGRLEDERTRKHLASLLVNLADWVARHRPAK